MMETSHGSGVRKAPLAGGREELDFPLKSREGFPGHVLSVILGFCCWKNPVATGGRAQRTTGPPYGLNTPFSDPWEGHSEGRTLARREIQPARFWLPGADALFSFPSRVGKAWAPSSCGRPGMAGERGTTAPVTATPTASIPCL